MSRVIDLKGRKFGCWTALEGAERNKHGAATWLCRCDCGREVVVAGNNLRRGISMGCVSCALKDNANRLTHGGAGTRLFGIWTALRQRCGNKNASNYKYYGGRGIAVCKEWSAFVAFRDWALANGYKEDLSIDRINNDGNYEPENCRWATAKQQQRNGRHNDHITINGRTRTLAE